LLTFITVLLNLIHKSKACLPAGRRKIQKDEIQQAGAKFPPALKLAIIPLPKLTLKLLLLNQYFNLMISETLSSNRGKMV